jgi:hypothetical protein
MFHHKKIFTCLGLFFAINFYSGISTAAVDPDDMRQIQAASCPRLIHEYRNYAIAERKVAGELNESNASTAAVNAFGVATIASLGIGFFTWDDNSSAEDNLTEIREIRQAIGEEIARKGCK